MKRKIIFLIFLITIIVNIFVIIFWNPTSISNNSNTKTVFNNTKCIYKTNKTVILECLSDKELNELNNVFLDLSTFDSSIVTEDLNSCNEERVIHAFRRLKRRLSKDKYQRVKQITSSLIDIDELDEMLRLDKNK